MERNFSEKVKANTEAFTEDLTKFVLDLKNKLKNAKHYK